MLITAEHPDVVAQAIHLTCGIHEATREGTANSVTGDVFLREIHFGKVAYKCPETLVLHCQHEGDGWISWERSLLHICVGRGASPELARQEWKRCFHAEFQRLYAMRPFEMAEDDRSKWQSLVNLVDVVDYRMSTPTTLQEIGCVRHPHASYPSQMCWIDGREERFDLDQVPSQMAGFKPGQWVEAAVERDAAGRLLRILHVQKISTPPSDQAAQTIWDAVPVANLPEVEWDWRASF